MIFLIIVSKNLPPQSAELVANAWICHWLVADTDYKNESFTHHENATNINLSTTSFVLHSTSQYKYLKISHILVFKITSSQKAKKKVTFSYKYQRICKIFLKTIIAPFRRNHISVKRGQRKTSSTWTWKRKNFLNLIAKYYARKYFLSVNKNPLIRHNQLKIVTKTTAFAWTIQFSQKIRIRTKRN